MSRLVIRWSSFKVLELETVRAGTFSADQTHASVPLLSNLGGRLGLWAGVGWIPRKLENLLSDSHKAFRKEKNRFPVYHPKVSMWWDVKGGPGTKVKISPFTKEEIETTYNYFEELVIFTSSETTMN